MKQGKEEQAIADESGDDDVYTTQDEVTIQALSPGGQRVPVGLVHSIRQHKKGMKCYTWILCAISLAVMLYFALGVLYYEILDASTFGQMIGSDEYIACEALANIWVIGLSAWIYWTYIVKRVGNFHDHNDNDCTNFDLYAVMSLLWLVTVCVLLPLYGDWGLFVLSLLRCVAIIVPGFVHKYYIRYQIDHPIYVGNVQMYKVTIIVFYAVQLMSNVVAFPLNAEWYQQLISEIFSLTSHSEYAVHDDSYVSAYSNNYTSAGHYNYSDGSHPAGSNAAVNYDSDAAYVASGDTTETGYNLPFILAATFGKPFVSIMLFHSVVLYLAWCLNGDKPNSYHNMDLFALSLGSNNNNANIQAGILTICLLMFDLLLHGVAVYELLYFLIYVLSSLSLVAFVVRTYACHEEDSHHTSAQTRTAQFEAKEQALHLTTNDTGDGDGDAGAEEHEDVDEHEHEVDDARKHSEMSVQSHGHGHNDKHHGVDWFEIMESLFVLLVGFTAIMCHIVSIHDFVEEADLAVKLICFCTLMVCQYIFIMYMQFHPDAINLRMLTFCGSLSLLAIMHLFLFEYEHFLDLVTHHHHVSATLKVSYALFWCLMEYFIWAFVTINHMVHHFTEQQLEIELSKMRSHKMKHSGIQTAEDMYRALRLSRYSRHTLSDARKRTGSLMFVHNVMHMSQQSLLHMQPPNDQMAATDGVLEPNHIA